MIKQYLDIRSTGKAGRGIYTREKIQTNTVIEISPVIVMTAQDRLNLDKTLLHDYIFEWGENNEECCMALGYIPLYNHSYKSNCEYFMDFEERLIEVKTIRVIEAGEELTINYNGDWNNGKRVWFEVRSGDV